MTETMTELSTTVSRFIPAPRDRVFDAWLDPDMLARFMIAGDGMSVPSVSVDPKVGGRFEILMRGEKDYPHAGTFREIDRPDRLVFTWESEWDAPGSTVTVTFKEADGGTQVELHQVRFPDEDNRDNHTAGWTCVLETLATVF
ncbi:MAG: SRPBCC domain-containing protein [Pseudomonadota bacterium]